MADRPNFYILLDLDPSEDDWAKIEERIREVKKTWSRDVTMGSPSRRREARRNLELLSEIVSVLSDPVKRRPQAQEAQRRKTESAREKLSELEDAIRILAAGGTLRAEQKQKLKSRFQDVLSPDEIEKRLAAAGLAVEPVQPRQAGIDPVLAGAIRRNLDLLGLPTLYELLGLPRTSSARALSERAREIYRENQRRGSTDADSASRNELAGICAVVFRDENAKATYDSFLVAQAMEAIDVHIDLIGGDGIISKAAVQALLGLARKRGISEEAARNYLEEYVARRGWKLSAEPVVALPDLKTLVNRVIRNVTSKSFGVVIFDQNDDVVVENLILLDDPVPCAKSLCIETREEGLQSIELRCMENGSREPRVDISECREIGKAELSFGRPLPKDSKIEITFQLGPDGLLSLYGKDLTTGNEVQVLLRTGSILAQEHLEAAKQRNLGIEISPGLRGNRRDPPPRQPERPRKKPGPQRDLVFISYSHEDKLWLEALRKHLIPFVRNKNRMTIWDDSRISAGRDWKKEIKNALNSAKVGVLLVSENFLASDFIVETELHPLLKAAREERLELLWLCISPCAWHKTEFQFIQAAHDPRRPLCDMRKAERGRVLLQICEKIAEAAEPGPPEPLSPYPSR